MPLSHLDGEGRARMVDVGAKPMQRRIARARGRIRLSPDTIALVRENAIKKGDVLAIAEIAGIQAAKRTCDLIPLCHTVMITSVQVRATIEADGVVVEGEAAATDKTGVEMEALTAVSVALLTVYDMCKAVDKQMIIGDIALIEKRKEPVMNA
ncbi:MAG TPA: cyclic pyranopterin monophosphate synthase MoaC [Candidatus Hydrogenedentes bacterium]|nr:cyclic pyranopterin monophosphate synthase MoaC [Candidatus Hydrogenedentota bacterium]